MYQNEKITFFPKRLFREPQNKLFDTLIFIELLLSRKKVVLLPHLLFATNGKTAYCRFIKSCITYIKWEI